MLIYLDTSHLVFLAEERSASPERFASFAEAWREAGCTLALSLYHLIELRQHPDAAVRDERHSVLGDLLPIRTQLDPDCAEDNSIRPVQDREIVQALLRKGHISVSGGDVEGWMQRYATAFPYTIGRPSQLAILKNVIELPVLGWVTGAMQSAHAMGARARSRPPGEKYRNSPRLRDLPDAPVPAEQLEAMMKIVESGLADPALLNAFTSVLTPEQMRLAMEEAMGPLRRMMQRAGEVGPRAAYAESMGTSDPARDRRRLNRVTHESLFADRVRSVASGILHITDPAMAESIARLVRVEDCPGTWLQHALEVEIERAEPMPEPGNAYDLEHSVHLPHVDVFTADKRITRYINQVIDRGGLPEALEGVARPVAAPKNLAALQQAVIPAAA